MNKPACFSASLEKLAFPNTLILNTVVNCYFIAISFELSDGHVWLDYEYTYHLYILCVLSMPFRRVLILAYIAILIKAYLFIVCLNTH